jgi:WhiB family redox-sensing transcriptional regulator
MTGRWELHAVCAEVGADWWFPEPHERVEPAVLATCARCPVRAACLDYALHNRVAHGIWAGLTAYELFLLRGADAQTVAAALARAGERIAEPVYYGSSRENRTDTDARYMTRRPRAARAALPIAASLDQLTGPSEAELAEAEALLNSLNAA